MKQKKLLFKINQFPQLSETFVTAQIITAIKCGFEVTILIKTLLNIEASKQEHIFRKYNLIDKIIVEDFSIPKGKLLRFIKAALLILLNIYHLSKLIDFLKEKNNIELSHIYHFHYYRRFKNNEIIHVQFGNNHQPFELLNKIGLLKAKLIVSFHGHDAFFPIYGVLKDGYYDNLFKYGDLIVANTQYLANQMLAIGCPKEKLKTIPVGVDTSFFKPENIDKENNKCINLITVGRLDKVKGHVYAITAVNQLHKKGYHINFTIVGDGEEMENLKTLIAKKKLQNIVHLVGRKSHHEIRELFRQNDIFIFTSVAVENERRETQGLTSLEAQASGLPAVVFDSGGVKYTVKEGVSGFVVPEYDIDVMVEKLEVLINNFELRIQMGRQAVAFMEKEFSQNIMDKQWCSIYNELIKNKNA